MFDAFDYYLLSVLLTSSIVPSLKNYFSEEAKMKRLGEDLISKSKLIGSSKSRKFRNSTPAKIQIIYKFALFNRDGADIPFSLAKKIERTFY